MCFQVWQQFGKCPSSRKQVHKNRFSAFGIENVDWPAQNADLNPNILKDTVKVLQVTSIERKSTACSTWNISINQTELLVHFRASKVKMNAIVTISRLKGVILFRWIDWYWLWAIFCCHFSLKARPLEKKSYLPVKSHYLLP